MPDNVLELTSKIVSSFLGKNRTSGTDLPALIRTVLAALTDDSAPLPDPVSPQTPAVTVRRSVTPDAILSMECGRPFKSLKRHLYTDHDLSPEGYREKWSLPKTYPMVAPAYSATRSVLAKSIGLGARGRVSVVGLLAADNSVAIPATPELVETSPALTKRVRDRVDVGAKPDVAKPSKSRNAKARDAR